MTINRNTLGTILLLVCGTALTVLNANEPMRRWRTRFGGVLTGVWQRELDEPDGSLIRIRSQANLYRVRVEDLSPEDQWYVLSQRVAESNEPEKVSSTRDHRPVKEENLTPKPLPLDSRLNKSLAPTPEANTDWGISSTDSDEAIAISNDESLDAEFVPIPESPEFDQKKSTHPQPDPLPKAVQESENPAIIGTEPDPLWPENPTTVESPTNRPLAEILAEANNQEIPGVEEMKANSDSEPEEIDEPEPLPPDTPGEYAGERRVYKIGDVSYAFRWCPNGSFIMGSPSEEPGRSDDETQHEVTLTHGFWILETEVTQAMWISVFDWNPSWFSKTGTGAARVKQVETGLLPVEQVTWEEAAEFCRKFRHLSGMNAELPTEAEWEYACRAGTQTVYSFGNTIQPEDANYDDSEPGNIEQKRKAIRNPYPVGEFEPNAWGIYDMHGNVAEWCRDLFGDLDTKPVDDPTGAETGASRVFRGGAWFLDSNCCRSAYRYGIDPDTRSYYLGFRVVIEPSLAPIQESPESRQ